MIKEDVRECLLNLLSSMGYDKTEAEQVKNLKVDLGMDSLDDASFMCTAEDACGVRISDGDMVRLVRGSLDDLVDFIYQHQQQQA